MKAFKLWTLTQENTSPFVIIAVLYSFFLGMPFFYFLVLAGHPHDFYEHDRLAAKQEQLWSLHIQQLKKLNKDTTVYFNNKPELNWRQDAESREYVMVSRIAIYSAVAAFGAIGAAVSLITRARNKKEVGNITPLELISIQTIGAIFAGILTLIFVADLIGGRVFPEPDLFYRIIYVHPAFAKLLIWCFIAGFSERFVPNILNNLVKQTDENKEEIKSAE
ncbi:hypothetical protein SAMN05428975_1175 [Mucilaginibacter sp. OK268]|uniref:hypothetical protein n=1 Tax=Mucilaginibacter sp. OK268 TaxID=1881048 RepID=UPI0008903365|nr:hypothetical protein [Mucilaginibacter sp. OK268]SDP33013.1 hypothetical protein SAMN05428975_1175 [Mucilaginibacter sp. OK268]